METVLSFLMDKSPIIALACICILVGFWVSNWYNRFKKVEEKIDALPCEKHEDLYPRFVNTEEKVKELPCSKHDELFHDIREKLVAIQTYITTKDTDVADVFSKKHSPRELNETGEKLYADIKGEEFLDKNKDILIQGIDNKTPKTALDVEESALEVLFSLIDNDMFIGMKNWVYNSSTRKVIIDGVEKDYAITMNDVCFVLSLPLRNMYLDLHPELKNMD